MKHKFIISNKVYLRDSLDKIISYLNSETVIVLHGARQVGKTHILYLIQTQLESLKMPNVYIDLEDPTLLGIFNMGVDAFLQYLKGESYKTDKRLYVLIDEIQYLDNPSSFMKLIADHYKNIHLIVSGSSTFEIKSKFSNSLVGRTVNFEIHPLSFQEFLKFKEANINLKEALLQVHIQILEQQYREFVVYGGYPKVVLADTISQKRSIMGQIINTYIRKDIRDFANVEDPDKFNNLLQLLASQTGQLLNVSRLSKEVQLSIPTINKYIFLLEETFILKRVRPTSHSSRVEIVKSPKIFFLDSGLASLLYMRDFPSISTGQMFETSVFAELVKHYGREEINFWRTKAGAEVDFVINLEQGEKLPIEAKLSFNSFNKKAILNFSTKYKTKNYKVIGLTGEQKNKHYIYPWEIKIL